MKLNEEQVMSIKLRYNDQSSVLSDDFEEGYGAGIHDTLVDLGYSGDEINEILRPAK